MNLLSDGGWMERTWPPEKPGFRWRRKRVAGDHLGASLYELPPGEKTFPYHYELGKRRAAGGRHGTPDAPRSRWRTRASARRLRALSQRSERCASDHQSRSNEPTRVLLVSNFAMPRAAVQVDSGKMMIRWGPEPEDRRWFRLDDAADYWEGEAE